MVAVRVLEFTIAVGVGGQQLKKFAEVGGVEFIEWCQVPTASGPNDRAVGGAAGIQKSLDEIAGPGKVAAIGGEAAGPINRKNKPIRHRTGPFAQDFRVPLTYERLN